jgi:UDP-GlcNAc:undecaprenyl-phosphate GlcNAc-1-phosphate transferase
MVSVPISTMLLLAVAAAVAAAVVSNLAVPLVAKLAMAVHALDYPGGRKLQEAATPRLGGVAIAGGVAFAAAGVALAKWVQLSAAIHRSELIAIAMAGALVFFVGFVDDLMGVSSWHKFGVEVLAALLLVHVGWQFHSLSLPGTGALPLGPFGPVITVLWIVGVTNAVNLLDGLDGLAAGVVAIIAASLLAYALLLGNLGTVILMASITGACLGFLRHNWAPAKIFMGDSGSLTLGFLLGAMTVHSSLKAPAAIAILVPLLALGVPVIDTLLVMVVRFLSRSHGALGERLLAMFRADRNHIHHLLLRRRGTGRRVVTWIYGTVLTFCVLAVVVAVTRNRDLGILVLVIEGLVMLGLRQSGLRARLAGTSTEQRQALRSELGVESGDGLDATGQQPAQVVAFPDTRRRSDGG